jgi:NitT/TauT family transport system substrate-binding protein
MRASLAVAGIGLMLVGSFAVVAGIRLSGDLSHRRGSGMAQMAAAPGSISMRLMGAFDPMYAGELVALGAGLFDREGLQIALRSGGASDDVIRLVADGTDTIGVISGERFILARSHGAPIVAFAAGYQQSRVVLYALSQSGIRTPAEFVGKRIGYQLGRDTAITYEAMMGRLALSRSRVFEVPVGTDLAPLLAGEVDVWPGYVGDESFIMESRRIRYNVIDPGSHGIHWPGTVYFAHERTIKESPDTIRRVLRALVAGWELAYANIATSTPLIVANDPSRLTPEFVRFKLEQQRGFLRPLGSRFGEFHDFQWRSLQDMLVQQRLINDKIDLLRAVAFDLVPDLYRQRGVSGL